MNATCMRCDHGAEHIQESYVRYVYMPNTRSLRLYVRYVYMTDRSTSMQAAHLALRLEPGHGLRHQQAAALASWLGRPRYRWSRRRGDRPDDRRSLLSQRHVQRRGRPPRGRWRLKNRRRRKRRGQLGRRRYSLDREFGQGHAAVDGSRSVSGRAWLAGSAGATAVLLWIGRRRSCKGQGFSSFFVGRYYYAFPSHYTRIYSHTAAAG